MGGDYTRGFEFAFAGSALNDLYTSTVGHNADWSPGENQVAYNVRCGGAPWKGGAFQWVRVPPGEMLQPEAT